MEFSKVIEARRAVRKYKPDPIPEEKLQRLYKALQTAPTANNSQPFRFIFVKDKKLREQIAKQACHQEFLSEPPILMVACCEKGTAFDAAIAVDHMTLAAVDEGLGTCWVGWIEKEVIRSILKIPSEQEIAILIPIGYPDENPPQKERKPLDEIITVL